MLVRSLASGSSGNSFLISARTTHILLDAGLSCRAICQRVQDCGIEPQELAGVFITHEHTDHVKGMAVLTKKLKPKVFATKPTMTAMTIAEMTAEGTEKQSFCAGEAFTVGDIEVRTFTTSHDSADSCGYTFTDKVTGEKVGYATDLGIVTNEVRTELFASTLLIVESNYDPEMLRYGSYPAFLKRRIFGEQGHLSNMEGTQLAVDCITKETKALWLAHLSRDNNSPQKAFNEAMAGLKGQVRHKMQLQVLPRDIPGPVYNTDGMNK